MIRVFLFFLLISSQLGLVGQPISFSKEIAPIISIRCTPCHQPHGDAPFDLTCYKNIYNQIPLIKYVINKGIMPPWKPSNDSSFINCRKMSATEISTINNWINSGAKCDIPETQNIHYKSNNFGILGKPDLIIKPSRPHKIIGNNQEEFVSYLLPNIKYDLKIQAVAIKPQNRKLTHHARLDKIKKEYVTTFYAEKKEVSTNSLEEYIQSSILEKIGFYVPGLHYVKYPNNSFLSLKANESLILNVHYAPSSITQYDFPQIYLYKSKSNSNREIITETMAMIDQTVIIPKDSFVELSYDFLPFQYDFSLISMQPHMHLLGKSIKVELINPTKKDTTELIYIPNWDFNWQEFYFLKKIHKIEKGCYVRLVATYDNTKNNPRNPFYPPKNISFDDMKTTNEMLSVFLQGFPYQQGDENLNLEKMYNK